MFDKEYIASDYQSDRTNPPTHKGPTTKLKTLCTGCQCKMEVTWPSMTTWAGEPCTAEEYMAKSLQSDAVGVYCDDCLEKMPDVNLEDLCYEPR